MVRVPVVTVTTDESQTEGCPPLLSSEFSPLIVLVLDLGITLFGDTKTSSNDHIVFD